MKVISISKHRAQGNGGRYKIDYENNAPKFWNNAPEWLDDMTGESDEFSLSDEQYEELTKVPGWGDGPAHARYPITPAA